MRQSLLIPLWEPVDHGGGRAVVRRAVKEDCKRMMELIQELAVYEKEPDAVTVSFDHFVECGFGENPIWWAFVATSPFPLL